jgi:AAA+ ATPase superfamily predicted ATPase
MIIYIMVMKFYNRERELELLDMLYKSRPSLLVVTGKRRVGKTELIKQFMKNKKSLYFFVDSNKSIDILMSEFNDLLKDGLELPNYVQLNDAETFLDFLTMYEGDVVVAIDEFQRFLKVHPSFITQLQKYWDMRSDQCRLFLIISGSSIGMIRKIFIEEKAPLFKRADNILTLKPFTIHEVFSMLEDIGIKDPDEKLNLYILFGGTIYYYRLFEKYQCTGFADALEKLIFNEFAPLGNEVRDVLIEEFGREHATYYEIISAISRGRCSLSEISDMSHVSANSLPSYFYDLIDLLGIVEHKIPITDIPKKSKRGRYFLKDNFFRFYGYFIYPMLSQYMAGNYATLMEKVSRDWNSFTGRIFEDICRELISKELIDEYPKIGPWWDRKGNEIDVVGVNVDENQLLVIEIKNMELSERSARNILRSTVEKVRFIKGSSTMQVSVGVIARFLRMGTG